MPIDDSLTRAMVWLHERNDDPLFLHTTARYVHTIMGVTSERLLGGLLDTLRRNLATMGKAIDVELTAHVLAGGLSGAWRVALRKWVSTICTPDSSGEYLAVVISDADAAFVCAQLTGVADLVEDHVSVLTGARICLSDGSTFRAFPSSRVLTDVDRVTRAYFPRVYNTSWVGDFRSFCMRRALVSAMYRITRACAFTEPDEYAWACMGKVPVPPPPIPLVYGESMDLLCARPIETWAELRERVDRMRTTWLVTVPRVATVMRQLIDEEVLIRDAPGDAFVGRVLQSAHATLHGVCARADCVPYTPRKRRVRSLVKPDVLTPVGKCASTEALVFDLCCHAILGDDLRAGAPVVWSTAPSPGVAEIACEPFSAFAKKQSRDLAGAGAAEATRVDVVALTIGNDGFAADCLYSGLNIRRLELTVSRDARAVLQTAQLPHPERLLIGGSGTLALTADACEWLGKCSHVEVGAGVLLTPWRDSQLISVACLKCDASSVAALTSVFNPGCWSIRGADQTIVFPTPPRRICLIEPGRNANLVCTSRLGTLEFVCSPGDIPESLFRVPAHRMCFVVDKTVTEEYARECRNAIFKAMPLVDAVYVSFGKRSPARFLLALQIINDATHYRSRAILFVRDQGGNWCDSLVAACAHAKAVADGLSIPVNRTEHHGGVVYRTGIDAWSLGVGAPPV